MLWNLIRKLDLTLYWMWLFKKKWWLHYFQSFGPTVVYFDRVGYLHINIEITNRPRNSILSPRRINCWVFLVFFACMLESKESLFIHIYIYKTHLNHLATLISFTFSSSDWYINFARQHICKPPIDRDRYFATLNCPSVVYDTWDESWSFDRERPCLTY